MPWVIKDAPFIDDWSERDYQTLIACLKHTVEAGGFVYAAFCDGLLKALFPLSPSCLAARNNTLICQAFMFPRINAAQGIGKALFLAARSWARAQGARKLYISAHSAVESQAFYRAMGCVEARVYNQAHVEAEPMIASWNAACK